MIVLYHGLMATTHCVMSKMGLDQVDHPSTITKIINTRNKQLLNFDIQGERFEALKSLYVDYNTLLGLTT